MTLTQMYAKARLLLGGISSTEYSDANLLIAINSYDYDFITKAIMANRTWNVQGEIATANIVANQQEYLLPTDLISIKAIEVNLTSGGAENQWTKVKIVDQRTSSEALTNQQDSDDTIEYAYEVRLYDESIFFNWLPKNSVTNGLKVYYSKEATALTASDTPNLPNFLQIGLVYGACMDYAIETEQNTRLANFRTLLNEKLKECEDYYVDRMPIVHTKITTKQRRFK